jgi:hypothetical protein
MGCRSYGYKYLHAVVVMEPYEIAVGQVAEWGNGAVPG